MNPTVCEFYLNKAVFKKERNIFKPHDNKLFFNRCFFLFVDSKILLFWYQGSLETGHHKLVGKDRILKKKSLMILKSFSNPLKTT